MIDYKNYRFNPNKISQIILRNRNFESSSNKFIKPTIDQTKTFDEIGKKLTINESMSFLKDSRIKRTEIYTTLSDLRQKIQSRNVLYMNDETLSTEIFNFFETHYKEVTGFLEISDFLKKMVFCANETMKINPIKIHSNLTINEKSLVRKKINESGKKKDLLSIFDQTNFKRIFAEKKRSLFDQDFEKKQAELSKLQKIISSEKIEYYENEKEQENIEKQSFLPPIIKTSQLDNDKNKDISIFKSSDVQIRNSKSLIKIIPQNVDFIKENDYFCEETINCENKKSYKELYDKLSECFLILQKKNSEMKEKNMKLVIKNKILMSQSKNQLQFYNENIEKMKNSLNFVSFLRKEKFELTCFAVEEKLKNIKIKNTNDVLNFELQKIVESNADSVNACLMAKLENKALQKVINTLDQKIINLTKNQQDFEILKIKINGQINLISEQLRCFFTDLTKTHDIFTKVSKDRIEKWSRKDIISDQSMLEKGFLRQNTIKSAFVETKNFLNSEVNKNATFIKKDELKGNDNKENKQKQMTVDLKKQLETEFVSKNSEFLSFLTEENLDSCENKLQKKINEHNVEIGLILNKFESLSKLVQLESE